MLLGGARLSLIITLVNQSLIIFSNYLPVNLLNKLYILKNSQFKQL